MHKTLKRAALIVAGGLAAFGAVVMWVKRHNPYVGKHGDSQGHDS